MPKPMSELHSASDIVRHNHEDPILVLFRVRNNRVDYSLDRPEPTLSNITDAVLMSALLDAGANFRFKRSSSLANKDQINRSDGRSIRYKESIEIDWHEKTITSSRGKDFTLKVLSIVVQDLSASAVRQEKSRIVANKHGAN